MSREDGLFLSTLMGAAVMFLALCVVGIMWMLRGEVFEAIRQGDHFYLDDTRYRCTAEAEPGSPERE